MNTAQNLRDELAREGRSSFDSAGDQTDRIFDNVDRHDYDGKNYTHHDMDEEIPGGSHHADSYAAHSQMDDQETNGIFTDIKDYLGAEISLHSAALSACADYFIRGLVSRLIAALLIVAASILTMLGILFGLARVLGDAPVWITLLVLAAGLATFGVITGLISKWFITQGRSVLAFVVSHWSPTKQGSQAKTE